MDYLKRLIVFCILAWSIPAFAGFAQLAPPSGWGGSAGSYTMPSAANASTFNGGFTGPGGSMNIGGKAVTMPAAYRFAANAGRFAAGFMFRNSLLGLTALGIGYVADQCLGVVGGQWKITCGPETGLPSDGFKWRLAAYQAPYFDTKALAVADWFAYRIKQGPQPGFGYTDSKVTVTDYSGTVLAYDFWYSLSDGRQFTEKRSTPWDKQTDASCPVGWYRTDQGCTNAPQPMPINESEFIERVAPKPIPADLPKIIPGPWPVEIPIINPAPGSDPKSRPLIVPDGSPRLVPNSDPAQWEQPGIRVNPAPTPSFPWQVDVEPVKTPVPGPDASPEPHTPGEDDPVSTPDETDDLCKKNPDIVACQTLGDAPAVPVVNEERQMSVKKDSGWGASDAQCPAPRQLNFVNRTVQLPLDVVCQFARGIRPFMIAFGWFIAAGMFYGFMRKG